MIWNKNNSSSHLQINHNIKINAESQAFIHNNLRKNYLQLNSFLHITNLTWIPERCFRNNILNYCQRLTKQYLSAPYDLEQKNLFWSFTSESQ